MCDIDNLTGGIVVFIKLNNNNTSIPSPFESWLAIEYNDVTFV